MSMRGRFANTGAPRHSILVRLAEQPPQSRPHRGNKASALLAPGMVRLRRLAGRSAAAQRSGDPGHRVPDRANTYRRSRGPGIITAQLQHTGVHSHRAAYGDNFSNLGQSLLAFFPATAPARPKPDSVGGLEREMAFNATYASGYFPGNSTLHGVSSAADDRCSRRAKSFVAWTPDCARPGTGLLSISARNSRADVAAYISAGDSPQRETRHGNLGFRVAVSEQRKPIRASAVPASQRYASAG